MVMMSYRREYVLFAVACVLFLAHAMLFRNWIIDDAAITYSYARSLAAGHGLVAQPGCPPVEGYSNFLWLIVSAVLILLRLFDPFVTPKIVSVLLVFVAFAVLHSALRSKLKLSSGAASLALVLTALSTPFAIWTTSGLENPLYVFLIALLFVACLRAEDALRGAPGAALIALAVSLTRPDGMVYSVAYPAAVAIYLVAGGGPVGRVTRWKQVLVYCVTFAAGYAAFLLFRLLYFHDLAPNTYHAKGGPAVDDAVRLVLLSHGAIARILDFLRTAVGHLSGIVFLLLIVLTTNRVSAGRFNARTSVLLGFLVLTAVNYLLMPGDWMKEYRFATPFYPFFFAYFVAIVESYLTSLHLTPKAQIALSTGLASAFILWQAHVNLPRSLAYAGKPDISLSRTLRFYGDRFNTYAKILGLRSASLLAPDAGGTLWKSKLRFYDLGMLCDRTIARTLLKDTARFREYVFARIKPTFIHTHGVYAGYARLDEDPRFRAEYVPISESVDVYLQERRLRVYSGDYVRREVLGKNADERLERLRAVRIPKG